MDHDIVKDLFSDFNPELSSSFQFMSKLQKNMEAVEIVKQHNAALKKRNKAAVAIAAICGFSTGIIITLLLPLIDDCVSTFSISLPHIHISSLTIEYSWIAWIAMGGASIITALNAYEIAMVKLTPNTTEPFDK